jgi:hypothetical protein
VKSETFEPRDDAAPLIGLDKPRCYARKLWKVKTKEQKIVYRIPK